MRLRPALTLLVSVLIVPLVRLPAQADARALLEELVAIDTTNPPGQEEKAARAVAAHLDAAGVKYELVPFAPGRTSLVARLRGDGKKRPLILMAHLDVVGAANQPWTTPPFTLTEKDGWLYGRGVSDDKGWAALATTVFLELAKTRTRLHRDLILVLTGDEESGGAGIRQLLEKRKDLIGDAELALNEGGSLKLDATGKVVAIGFQASEKVYQDFEVIARGRGGHSAVPNDENPIYRLARGLARLESFRFPPRLTPAVREMLRAAAQTQPEPRATALRKVAESDPKSPPPADALATLDAYPLTRAMTRTSCVATLVQGGTRENALPVEAKANVNCRILPVDPVADVEKQLATLLGDPALEVRALKEFGAGPELPIDGPIRAALRKVADEQFGKQVVVAAGVGLGATDSRFLRKAGIQSYGVGLMAKPEEQIRNPHGPDEGVPVASVAMGEKFLRALVREIAER
jgi:acetylornithine deacetylase/succinyl-diaminopimelate desuccinylase-like protein